MDQMMRKLTIYFFVLSIAASWATPTASGSCTGSDPTWTSTPDRASVASCVTSAASGSTVNVTSGSASWSSSITIHNKSLNIIGGNGGTTTINISNGFFVLTRGVGGQNQSRISNFTVNQTGTSPTFHVNSDQGRTPQGWRFDHITRNNSSSTILDFFWGWGGIIANDGMEGLIDNNTINNGRIEYYGEPVQTGGRFRWSEPLNLGTANAVYVEDNSFVVTSPSGGGQVNQIDGNLGSRIVVRFNTFTNGRVEQHSVQSDNTRAVRMWQFYNNTFTSNPADRVYRFFFIRGGTGLIFHNTTDGNASVDGINFDNIRSHQADVVAGMVWGFCDGSSFVDGNSSGGEGYLCRDQIGASTDASLWDYSNPAPVQQKFAAYMWRNIESGAEMSFVWNCVGTATQCTRQQTKHIVLNRNVFGYSASFNGTVGVGEGSLANRPSTCSVGVGYWATDQGEWNSRNPGADGQLYTCTATNTWSLTYTPYAYPHPLQSSAGGAKGPEPPTNLVASPK
jgi:hypothetical protein